MGEIERRALEWLLSDDTGMSSKTLCAHMLGIDYGRGSAPFDSGDRGRCVRLLRAIPEWQDRLDEMLDDKPTEAIVIGSGGMRVESNGWTTQIPLIKAELKSAQVSQSGEPKEDIAARVKQLCIIAENDGKHGITYFPKPYEYGPYEIEEMVAAHTQRKVIEQVEAIYHEYAWGGKNEVDFGKWLKNLLAELKGKQ